jgi:hypothetical protein
MFFQVDLNSHLTALLVGHELDSVHISISLQMPAPAQIELDR